MKSEYCYMFDVLGESFEGHEYNKIEIKEGVWEYYIKEKLYKDPDAVSRKLYEDMISLFSSKEEDSVIKISKEIYGTEKQWYMHYWDSKAEKWEDLSMDYIGPSRKNLEAWGVNSATIGNTILNCRILGGHIFWPAHKRNGNTINQARGGRPLFDRIDLALAELKFFFNKEKKGSYLYSKSLRNAYERYEEWLNQFGDFKTYIDYFLLNAFVDANYDVVSLADSELHHNVIKLLEHEKSYVPKNLKQYMDNCQIAIKGRSIDLVNQINHR